MTTRKIVQQSASPRIISIQNQAIESALQGSEENQSPLGTGLTARERIQELLEHQAPSPTLLESEPTLREAEIVYETDLFVAKPTEVIDKVLIEMAAADNLYNQGKYDQALAKYKQVAAISEEWGNPELAIISYNNIASIHYFQGNYNQALEMYQQADVTIKTRLGHSTDWIVAVIYNNIASIHYDQGDYDQALERYQQAAAILEESGDQAGLAAIYNNIASAYYAEGKYDQAQDKYQEAIKLKEQVGDQIGLANSYHNLGNVYYMRGEGDQALAQYQRALGLAEEQGLGYNMAHTHRQLGLLYHNSGYFKEARDALARSMETFADIGLTREANAALFKLALHFVQEGKWFKSVNLLEDYLATHQFDNDPDARADVIYQIGVTHHFIDNFDLARNHYRKALRTYSETGNMKGRAACQFRLGCIALQTGTVSKASRQLLEQAKHIYSQLNDRRLVAGIERVLRLHDRVEVRQSA